MWHLPTRALALLLPLTALLVPPAAAAAAADEPATTNDDHLLRSTSLNTCQDSNKYTASLFNVIFTPRNGIAYIRPIAISSVQGYAVFDIAISAYGYEIIRKVIDPCDVGLPGLCPMSPGKTDVPFNLKVDPEAVRQIPGIAYTFPDLDAKVKVFINMTSGDDKGTSAACLEAEISNGRTVDLIGVKWASALVAFFALVSSAVISYLGHFNAASHVAVNTLSLFSYFQAQAMIGLCGMPLPPVVQAWTQDFAWSLGVIKLDFMQRIFTWYQRATGGTPSTIFDSLTTISVEVQKRSMDLAVHAPRLAKRGNLSNNDGSYVVYGIQRVAFRAGIESTNLFLTVVTFFSVLLLFTVIAVSAFKGVVEFAAKRKWIQARSEKMLEFRNGWRTILKGILFRMTLVGYPAVTIFSLWEFTQNDSPAEMVLAVFFLFCTAIALGWAAYTVIRIASRSINMHRNPAYILFSDPRTLNKWGFLYIQFRASGYYFSAPVLGYILIKAIFIAFAQHVGKVQAIAFILIEAAALITATVMRPWMDKSTNTFNISICAVNFVNAIFLLIFTDVFDQPPLVTGVVGVVFWIINASMTLILLLMIIVSTAIIFFRNNPDARYQYMADDRTSFVKSQVHLTNTELDALGATARGDRAGMASGLDLDDDGDSISSDFTRRRMVDPANYPLPPSRSSTNRDGGRSPINPLLESPRSPMGARSQYSLRERAAGSMRASPALLNPASPKSSPNLIGAYRNQNSASPDVLRTQHSPSPWKRGIGYEDEKI